MPDKTEERFRLIEKRLSMIDGAIADIRKSLSGAVKFAQDFDESIDKHRRELDDLKKRLAKLDASAASMDKSLDKLDTELDDARKTVGKLDFDTVFRQFFHMKEEIDEVTKITRAAERAYRTSLDYKIMIFEQGLMKKVEKAIESSK